jgi:phage terminase small subunit
MMARFAEEYPKDLSTTQAAIRAGYAPRYADRQGSACLGDSRVRARIAELQAQRLRRVEVDSDFVLRRLLEEVNADAGELYDASGDLLPVKQWPEVWRRGLVTTIRTTRLYGRGADRGTEIGIQTDVVLVDRARRLELLGKHIKVNAFSERLSVGLDTPLQELFKQIQGNVIRPASTPDALLPQPMVEIEPEAEDEEHNP